MLRDSKLLVLPSRQRLCMERHCIRPTVGFNDGVIQQLRELSEQCEKEHQQLAILVIDEMNIKGKKECFENLTALISHVILIGFV